MWSKFLLLILFSVSNFSSFVVCASNKYSSFLNQYLYNDNSKFDVFLSRVEAQLRLRNQTRSFSDFLEHFIQNNINEILDNPKLTKDGSETVIQILESLLDLFQLSDSNKNESVYLKLNKASESIEDKAVRAKVSSILQNFLERMGLKSMNTSNADEDEENSTPKEKLHNRKNKKRKVI